MPIWWSWPEALLGTKHGISTLYIVYGVYFTGRRGSPYPFFKKGNTARRFFQEYEKVAKILEIPEFLVKDLGKIWSIVVSGLSVNTEKFGELCEMFVAKFNMDKAINWYEFSPTLHKIIVHGKECMEYFPVPIGWLSEGSFSFK